MSRKIFKSLIVFSLLIVTGISAFAQNGAYTSYSPYSIFGVGDITKQGNAYTKGMGGVGVATRSNRYINYLNPASVTARDTLSFMMDFGLTSENKVYKQGNITSANNAFNISDIVFSFPIHGKTAMIMGITPFSSVGYYFSHPITDPSIIGQTGNIYYSSKGSGDMYQLFVGAGTMLFNRLSLGAEFEYFFGNIIKNTSMTFSNSSYRSISSGYTLELNAATGKFGMQYDQPLGKDMTLTLGATYRLGTDMKGSVTDFKYASVSEISDTLSHNINRLNGEVKIADELGIGISLKKGDKWRGEFNYMKSDWGKSGMGTVTGFANMGSVAFSATDTESYRAGFEIVPNRNDIRYYLRRCAYRAGIYYDKAYYKLDGNQINSYGLTLGVTLPVFRWYNGLSLGVDIGRKGNVTGNITRENYAMFVIGFNIHDIWFQKPRYD